MRYITKLGHQLACKNNLQRDVNSYLESLDRILLNSDADITDFKERVIAEIEVLNVLHSRCKALAPRWYQIGINNDIYLSGVEFCLFTLHEVKQDYSSYLSHQPKN